MLKIHIPKGSKHGAYIAHMSGLPNEKEFLIDKGKNIRIHPRPEIHRHIDKDTKTYIWHAHIED